MAHAPSRICDIALSPRDQMYVAVKDCLTGRTTGIYADVKAGNTAVALLDSSLCLFEQQIAGVSPWVGPIQSRKANPRRGSVVACARR